MNDAGVEPVRLPARSPDLNAHLERSHLSIKSECFSRMIFFGEKMLRNAISSYLVHYHRHRSHQGLDNRLIEPADEVGQTDGEVRCQESLGGVWRYYYRDAA